MKIPPGIGNVAHKTVNISYVMINRLLYVTMHNSQDKLR